MAFFLLVASATDEIWVETDKVLYPYYLRFMEEAKNMGRKVPAHRISIKFGNVLAVTGIPRTAIAACQPLKPVALITIDKPFFDNSPEPIKENIVFHELGHCILDRGHESHCLKPDTYSDNCELKKSIMNPQVIEKGYMEMRPFLIMELFSKLPKLEVK